MQEQTFTFTHSRVHARTYTYGEEKDRSNNIVQGGVLQWKEQERGGIGGQGKEKERGRRQREGPVSVLPTVPHLPSPERKDWKHL